MFGEWGRLGRWGTPFRELSKPIGFPPRPLACNRAGFGESDRPHCAVAAIFAARAIHTSPWVRPRLGIGPSTATLIAL